MRLTTFTYAHACRYGNRVRQVNYGNCYYFKPLTLEDLGKVDAHMACAFNNINYRNPAEFTLVLTGEGPPYSCCLLAFTLMSVSV